MSQSPRAILFDLDGTLLDTAPEFTFCLNMLLNEQGMTPIPVNQLRQVVSGGAKAMLELGSGLPADHAHFQTFMCRFLEFYTNNLGQFTDLFPGIAQVIQELEQRKMLWAIVTNKPKAFAEPLVRQFSEFNHVACVISGDSLAYQKPDPRPIIHACQLMGIPPEDCWYVGDALADVKASQQAGMPCAVVNYGYIPQDIDPTSWGADRYLSSANEIATLFAK